MVAISFIISSNKSLTYGNFIRKDFVRLHIPISILMDETSWVFGACFRNAITWVTFKTPSTQTTCQNNSGRMSGSERPRHHYFWKLSRWLHMQSHLSTTVRGPHLALPHSRALHLAFFPLLRVFWQGHILCLWLCLWWLMLFLRLQSHFWTTLRN
jgi:hypothetical protein